MEIHTQDWAEVQVKRHLGQPRGELGVQWPFQDFSDSGLGKVRRCRGVTWGGWNKVLQTRRQKTTEIYCLTALETKVLRSRRRPGCGPSETCRGGSFPHLLASGALWLVGAFLQHLLVTWLSSLCVYVSSYEDTSHLGSGPPSPSRITSS